MVCSRRRRHWHVVCLSLKLIQVRDRSGPDGAYFLVILIHPTQEEHSYSKAWVQSINLG